MVVLGSVLFGAINATAAEIAFKLFRDSGGDRVLVAHGTKSYSGADFAVRREERDSRFYGIRKELPLYDGFSIGILDTLDQEVTGFGLSVGHLPFGSRPNDFSWEWYNKTGPDEFTKLQGGSKVRVTFFGMPSVQEIRSITFLGDATFGYIEDLCCEPENSKPTHLLIIKAGSVLELPTDGTGQKIQSDR